MSSVHTDQFLFTSCFTVDLLFLIVCPCCFWGQTETKQIHKQTQTAISVWGWEKEEKWRLTKLCIILENSLDNVAYYNHFSHHFCCLLWLVIQHEYDTGPVSQRTSFDLQLHHLSTVQMNLENGIQKNIYLLNLASKCMSKYFLIFIYIKN